MNHKSMPLISVFVVIGLLVSTSIFFILTIQPAQASKQFSNSTQAIDWLQVNTDGFGDSRNSILSLEVFNGELFASTFHWDLGGSIWRYNHGTSWTRVSETGFGNSSPGAVPGIPDMIVFNDYLYASTGWGGAPGQIWRSDDGTSWMPIVNDGFGNLNNLNISLFAIFDNTLYATVGNDPDGLQIWRSTTGNVGTWEQVVNDGFDGDSNNRIVCGAAEMDGYLYMSVENITDGIEIWRTNNGVEWSQVNQNGFGDIANGETGGLLVYNGFMYSGTRNDFTGTQIWRSSNGTTWTQVVNNGFGDIGNYKTNLLFSFNGFIYAGVNNETTGIKIWRSSDGIDWNQINDDGFGDANNIGLQFSNSTTSYQNSLYIGTFNQVTGGEVWLQMKQFFLPLLVRQ